MVHMGHQEHGHSVDGAHMSLAHAPPPHSLPRQHYLCWSDVPVPRISVIFSLEELKEIEKDCATYAGRMERVARHSSVSKEEKVRSPRLGLPTCLPLLWGTGCGAWGVVLPGPVLGCAWWECPGQGLFPLLLGVAGLHLPREGPEPPGSPAGPTHGDLGSGPGRLLRSMLTSWSLVAARVATCPQSLALSPEETVWGLSSPFPGHPPPQGRGCS